MTELTETKHDLGFILSEANGSRSRASIVVASGAGILAAGTVLGANSAGKYLPSTVAAGDGEEVATAVLAYGVDATSADVSVAAIVRDAEVVVSELAYAADVDQDAEKLAKQVQLAAVGIISR